MQQSRHRPHNNTLRLKRAELSVERLELTNKIRALVPWVMLITMFVAAVVLARNWSRFRVIYRDQYGDAPLLVVDSVAVDMDRNRSFTTSLQSQDLKQLPKPSSTDQEQVTARDQLLDISSRRRSLTGDSAARKALARQIANSAISSGSSNPQLHVIDIPEARSLFMAVMRWHEDSEAVQNVQSETHQKLQEKLHRWFGVAGLWLARVRLWIKLLGSASSFGAYL